MSYVVLARKWRPMKFADVVSQEHVTVTLANAIRQNRIASAYLFSGPRGVGKTTTARILAKAINCDDGPSPEPCNQCGSCTEITEGRSLDVFEIDGASNRGIDEVRNLREKLRYAPSPGKHKIYIIDEVHMLTTEAFNALLKTLEEPPPHVLFVFATTELHKVPATILSRCQRFDFRRIPLNAIVEKLKQICVEEGISIDDDTLMLIAKKAEGSMRDSQSLLDQMVSFCGQEIQASQVVELLGIIDQELFFDAAAAVHERNVGQALDLAERVFTQGLDISEFLNELAEHFRNLLVLRRTGEASLLRVGENYLPRYQEQAQEFSDLDLLRLIQIASETAQQVKYSPNPRLRLEISLLKMVHLDRSVQVDELLAGLEDIKKNALKGSTRPPIVEIPLANDMPSPHLKNSASVLPFAVPEVTLGAEQPSVETQGAVDGAQVEVSLETLQRRWADVVQEVKKTRISLGSFLEEGYPTAVQGDMVEISFGEKNGFHIRTVQSSRNFIQRVIAEVTGMRVRIVCRKDDRNVLPRMQAVSPPEESGRPALRQQPKSLEQLAEELPVVKKMIELFDVEMISSPTP
jgi:DNA polymerase-3 subunit gamma/tau